MLQGWVIVVVSFAYLGLLFAIAYYGDKRADAGRSIIARPSVYALSLAVYATSWTFYGSVGRASSTGVGFLPVYLGPTLMFALGWLVLRKIIRISKENRITSIADFVASRYGKSTLLGGLVAVIAVVGIVPYISLQLKAISDTFGILLGYPDIISPAELEPASLLSDKALYVALLLAVFTILFGTRKLDAAERHEGMVAAIAFESLVKLVAFLAVGLFVTFGVFGGFGDLFGSAAALPNADELFTVGEDPGFGGLLSLTLLSMLAIVLLPRQFQVTVVENVDERHLNKAMWLFPLYLLAINLFVLPIALGGLTAFQGAGVNPDYFVLALPMAEGQEALALFVYVGGISAATAMVIVEAIALSTMVSNNLLMPALLRTEGSRLTRGTRPDAGPGHEAARAGDPARGDRRSAAARLRLLPHGRRDDGARLDRPCLVRRSRPVRPGDPRRDLLEGRHAQRRARRAARRAPPSGLYTLLLPSFARSGLFPASFLTEGPFGIELLRPEQLLGLDGLDSTSHAMFWSMLVNVGLYVGVSLFSRPQRGRAHAGGAVRRRLPADRRGLRGSGAAAPRSPTCRRCSRASSDAERASEALAEQARERGLRVSDGARADPELVHHVETAAGGLDRGSVGTGDGRLGGRGGAARHGRGDGHPRRDLPGDRLQPRARAQVPGARGGDRRAAGRRTPAHGARPPEGRLRLDGHPRAAHAADVDARASRRSCSRTRSFPPDERERFLRIVIEEIERLTRLINQVLDLSKIESGSAEWQIGEIDLKEIVEDSATATAQLFSERDAELQVRLPEAVPAVAADRDRIKQVMLNLLSNAAKFCDAEHGRVAVEFGVADGALRVDVRDNGPGIEREDQQLIFEKFRQGGDGLTERTKGTGLGLPICREIVAYLGGELWVESEPGSGATFSFTLPVTRCAPGRGAGEGLMATRVLIVDDEPNIVTSIEFLMRQRGYETRVARNGDEALSEVESFRPHLVLLDVMLPHKDGFEVCQQLRAGGWADLKIVMLTAKGRDIEIEKGLALGADAYVTKPFSTGELVARVSEMLDSDA